MNDYIKAQDIIKIFEQDEPIEQSLNYNGLSLWWFIRPGILGQDVLQQVTGEKRDTGKQPFSYFLLLKRVIVGLWRLFWLKKGIKTLVFTRGKDFVDGKDQIYGGLFDKLDNDYVAIDFSTTKEHMKQCLKRGSRFIPWEAFYFKSMLSVDVKYEVSKIEQRLPKLKRKFKLYKQYTKHFKKLISSVRNIETARLVIRKYGIKQVLCVDERCSGLTFITAAKLEGIKSYGIQHGLISKINLGYHLWDKVSPILPDKTMVWGPVHKGQLLDFGYKPDQVEIVGVPRLENIGGPRLLRSALRDDHYVVYFAQQAMTDKMKQDIINTFKKLTDYDFFIKLHPEEKSKVFINAKGDNYQTYTSASVEMSIVNCDIVLGNYSTTLMDAAVFNKPIIVLNLMATEDITGLVDYGLATEITNLSSLGDALKKVKVKDNSLYLRQYCLTDNVIDKIMKVT